MQGPLPAMIFFNSPRLSTFLMPFKLNFSVFIFLNVYLSKKYIFTETTLRHLSGMYCKVHAPLLLAKVSLCAH
jgi:hypothetical protein